jgi:cyclic pyranopterin phosphate synthase
MVDVTGKPSTRRVAVARCSVQTSADVAEVLADPSGGTDLIESARWAGILAAKQTSSLIPLCHPIRVDSVRIDIEAAPDGLHVTTTAEIDERTGVEMEALTGCAPAALVLVHALLGPDPGTRIDGLTLWHKSGGRSGTWTRVPSGTMRGPSGARAAADRS